MIPKEYIEVVETLLERTQARAIRWEETSSFSCFSAQIGCNMVNISREEDINDFGQPTGVPDTYRLRIYNIVSDPIDEFAVDCTEEGYNQMCEIYDAARRFARKIDVTIAELLRDMKNSKPISVSL